jgi:octaprenyl-diphosphate synthase
MSTAARQRTPATDALRAIQAPVRERLERVVQEMHTIVSSDLPMIERVSTHLLRIRGKMFRPTLTLLASAVMGEPDPRAISLAAVVELMHLATLVHDDSVDHSVLRRGLPTVNSLFSHQVSVIMGDFLYTRAHRALVEVGDLEFLRILTTVANELTIGEMRQLGAVEGLEFSEEDYFALQDGGPGFGCMRDGGALRRRTVSLASQALRRAAGHVFSDRRRHSRLHIGFRDHWETVGFGST